MIGKEYLITAYIKEGKSVCDIARFYGCSQNKITYWLQKHRIKKRTISEAIYLKSNPSGDPFKVNVPKTNFGWFLYGLGLGLFWGEGNKVNKSCVRLGNTDAGLIKMFLLFLSEVYEIDTQKLRFGLQIFTDMSSSKAMNYWVRELGVSKRQFQKVIVTKSTKKGTYRKKCEFGVLTIYFSNTKLRDIIVGAITELQKGTNLPS